MARFPVPRHGSCFVFWLALAACPKKAQPPPSANDEEVAFVSDGTSAWGNWDIYLRNLRTRETRRLTTHAAIDNHPALSPTNNWIVWSSNRGASGEFDLYLADRNDVEGTIKQLTNDAYPNGPQTAYPDRHPHFHPNGQMVIFTSKNRPLTSPIQVISECSVPKIIAPPRYFEGMNVITLDGSGNVASYKELDVRDAWDKVNYPSIWVDSVATYTGHPGFSHDGTKVIFTASVDLDAKVWEVYVTGFDAATASLVPGSLRRVTNGPSVGANPIQMSGGAHFSRDDATIYFSSTRTSAGNSLIFSVPATATDVPVTSATPITNHAGNDYIPEPLDVNRLMVTSDLGPVPLCGGGAGDAGAGLDAGFAWGPTLDLDLVIVTPDGGDRTPFLPPDNTDNEEMFLIGDEVSWFCGLKPNLSSCTFLPRVVTVENLWIGKTAWLEKNLDGGPSLIPDDLLGKFNYDAGAKEMYATAWDNMEGTLGAANPSLWETLRSDVIAMLDAGFPGLSDAGALDAWLAQTAALRNKKYVVPSVMYERGIGRPLCQQTISVSMPTNQSCSRQAPVSVTGSYGVTAGTAAGLFNVNVTFVTSHAIRPLEILLKLRTTIDKKLFVGVVDGQGATANYTAWVKRISDSSTLATYTASGTRTDNGGVITWSFKAADIPKSGLLESVDEASMEFTDDSCFGNSAVSLPHSACPWP